MTEKNTDFKNFAEEIMKSFEAIKPFTATFGGEGKPASAFADILKATPIKPEALFTAAQSLFEKFPIEECGDACFCTGDCAKETPKTGCFDFDFGHGCNVDFTTGFERENLFGAHNVVTTEKTHTVTVAVPGVTKDENLAAYMQEDVLHIDFTASDEKGEEEAVDVESAFGYFKESFKKEIALEKADSKSIKATLANGELTIVVKKVEDVVTNITIK